MDANIPRFLQAVGQGRIIMAFRAMANVKPGLWPSIDQPRIFQNTQRLHDRTDGEPLLPDELTNGRQLLTGCVNAACNMPGKLVSKLLV